MNLSVTIPENWQKHPFEKWMHTIEMRLKRRRYQELKEYPEMLRDGKIRIINN